MQGVALSHIIQWTDPRVVGILGSAAEVTGVSTDSRTVGPGQVFLALQGDRFDGHDFVGAALGRGAVAAIVARRWADVHGRTISGGLLAVESPLAALGAIARHYRQRFTLPVIAVVGSAGKTTTKEMTAAVLGRRLRVLKNRGNENNEIGVPKALLELDSSCEAVVVELAARRLGDIDYLCSLAQPNVGVLLNIGTAHLGVFGTVERVAKAKGEILEYLDESSTALINVDDCVVAREAKKTKGRLLGFSLRRESVYRGEGLVLDQEGCGHFSLQQVPFSLRVPGRHNVYNALAAAAVGHIHGVSWPEIAAALAEFQPVSMRSDVHRRSGWTLLDDSYNANPESVRAALDLLAAVGAQRRIAVLGDMLELGPTAAQLHRALGRHVAMTGTQLLLTTGSLSEQTAAGAQEAGMPPDAVRHFADRDTLARHLQGLLRAGDAVLVKGSRATGLDGIVGAVLR
jgi:UDP-N-acetylmuramoyl-tripeptide--D-alanyl-D-alanine ligase